MHELGLTRNIVAIVSEHAAGRPVKKIRLAVGPLACVEKSAIEFCFEIVAEGTSLASAKLAFVDAEGDAFTIKDYELGEQV